MHTRSQSTVARVIHVNYYWPTLRTDAKYVKTCKECQEFSNVLHTPLEALHSITSPWPFAMCGMDILEPFPMAKGQVKFLLITVEYFTKWIKAEPLARIIAQKVQNFTWKNIIYRYDLPQAIVTDNGRQFIEKDYEEFLKQLGVKHFTSSIKHPQISGQAKATNKIIISKLCKRLSKVPKGLWVDELPSVLWGYHCTSQSTTQDTPFKLTYSVNAMLPVQIDKPSLRRSMVNMANNS